MAPCVDAYFLAPCNSPLILVLMAYNRLKSFRKFFLNTLWPSYRGKRAGRLVRERERVSIKQIAIVSTRKVGRPWFSAPLRSVTLRYAPLRSVTLPQPCELYTNYSSPYRCKKEGFTDGLCTIFICLEFHVLGFQSG